MRLCDELDFGFGWIVPGPPVPRTSHALLAEGGVWLIEPVDVPGLDERVTALGEPRGVLQLLDRHERDSVSIAERFGVPHHRLGSRPFEAVELVRFPGWREVALWWPERRVLLAADAVGTLPYFCEPDTPLGIHPFLRLTPPRRLLAFDPLHVLVGHGKGVHEGAGEALKRALARSRRGLIPALLNGIRNRGNIVSNP